jgi:hypothetical protein
MSVQILELNGVPALAVLPIDEWETLLERLETLQDIADAKAAMAVASPSASRARPVCVCEPIRTYSPFSSSGHAQSG